MDNKPVRELIAEAKAEVFEEIEEGKEEEEEEETDSLLVHDSHTNTRAYLHTRRYLVSHTHTHNRYRSSA